MRTYSQDSGKFKGNAKLISAVSCQGGTYLWEGMEDFRQLVMLCLVDLFDFVKINDTHCTVMIYGHLYVYYPSI